MNNRNLLPKNMLVGSLHLEWKRCARASCKCNKGLLHGPYVYRHWREKGRQHKSYIPMSTLSEVFRVKEALGEQFPQHGDLRRMKKNLRYD